MTILFRNDSPEALTRHQAMELEKKRRKERERQARALAAAGRGEDTEIAHVALGELVIPAALQTPELVAALRRVAAEHDIPLERLRVGSAKNRINPNTGAAEFGSAQDQFRDGYDRFDPPDGIFGESYPTQGYYDASNLFNVPVAPQNVIEGITVVGSPWDDGQAFNNINAFAIGDQPSGEWSNGSGGTPIGSQKPQIVTGPSNGAPVVRSPRASYLPTPTPQPANRLPRAPQQTIEEVVSRAKPWPGGTQAWAWPTLNEGVVGGDNFGGTRKHNGVDLRSGLNQPIRAPIDGKVLKVSNNARSGNYILIRDDFGNVYGFAHTGSKVKQDQMVKAGEEIGITDRSGTGTGPHLHFTYRPGTPDAPATPNSPTADPNLIFEGLGGLRRPTS